MSYSGYFDSGRFVAPVDWGVPGRLETKMSEELRWRYTVVKPDCDVAQKILDKRAPTRGDFFNNDDEIVVQLVKQYGAQCRADAIVVITDAPGAYYRYSKGGGGGSPFYIGFFYRVYVFDGRTLDILGKEWGLVYRDNPLTPYDQPAIDTDLGWRGEPYDEIRIEVKEKIRRGVYTLLDRSVPFTLNRLNLVPNSVSDAAK